MYKRQELNRAEGIQLEPSALAGMPGAVLVEHNCEYLARLGIDDSTLANATHLVWATGGGMVPEQEMAAYLAKSSV